MTERERKIKDKKVTVGILGLGYVGLPLVREFASVGLKVVGFDIDDKKVKTLNSGRSIIKYVAHSQIKKMVYPLAIIWVYVFHWHHYYSWNLI